MRQVVAISDRGVRLATTAANVRELRERLVAIFGLDEAEASLETDRIVGFFELVYLDTFEHLRPQAEARLSVGGKSDWPTLAAAMTFEGAVWTDDRDFFGVGVPVWSSGNVRFAEVDQ
jgi:hypothetical protein